MWLHFCLYSAYKKSILWSTARKKKGRVLIGSWLKALQHSKMLMAAWLTFGSNDIRSGLLGFFYNFIEKYEIFICYSEHVDLFMNFYLARSLFLFAEYLGIPSLQCQWGLFRDKETQLWFLFPWTARVTAHCVHGLDKAMSMQRKELLGGEENQKTVSF